MTGGDLCDRARERSSVSKGYDDSSWPLQTKNGRHGGEVRLIMHYSGANANSYLPSASAPHVSMYSTPPQSSSMINPLVSTGAYPMPPVYPPLAAPYPPQPYPPAQQPYGSHYSHGYAYPGGYTTLY